MTDRTVVSIDDGFWSSRLRVNRETAIFYQWERYEECGTVDNFRIAAGIKAGVRRGFFYTDSDLHKWADAASRILETAPDPRLERLLAEYVGIMTACQEPDGYLFTYNQVHFPGTRWKNLMIEHELYCHGHFIEAGIAHRRATGSSALFDPARKAADLIVRDFLNAPAQRTSGHQEIETALLELYRETGVGGYRDTALALLERRGRTRFFGLRFAGQALSQARRSALVRRRNRTAGGPAGGTGFEIGENLTREEPRFIMARAIASFFGGSYQQQHAPIRRQVEPKGHAVRWAYMMRAIAMAQAETGDDTLARLAEEAWTRLVDGKMYVTGGIGALPVIEGFGRPGELDNRFSYSETCAAIGCLLWNRELSHHSGDARYADLIEWQLFNAASVGVSLDGMSYFYRNPLASRGSLQRKGWYDTACCPSNISRLLADLHGFIYLRAPRGLRIDQYIGSRADLGGGLVVDMTSGLPWDGRIGIDIRSPSELDLTLRAPGWTAAGSVRVNGAEVLSFERAPQPLFGSGRFQGATYLRCALPAGASRVDLDFPLAIVPCTAPARVRADRGRVAVTRGPLVYCAESIDNGGGDPSDLVIDPAALRWSESPGLVPGTAGTIEGATADGSPVRLIPYPVWGNRGPAGMAVWLKTGGTVAH